MKNSLHRRDFARRTASGACGIMAGSLLGGGHSSLGQERDSSEKRLVLLGLNALARAHEMSDFTDGHRGASLVAAHLMCVENKLDAEATARITELFDLNWASAPLCAPFPETDPDPSQIKRIGLALADGNGVLREVGHDAIFAMLAIRGFCMLPGAATPERIDGVCKLI